MRLIAGLALVGSGMLTIIVFCALVVAVVIGVWSMRRNIRRIKPRPGDQPPGVDIRRPQQTSSTTSADSPQ